MSTRRRVGMTKSAESSTWRSRSACLVLRRAVRILEVLLVQQRRDAVVQTVVALLGGRRIIIKTSIGLGFGHHLAQMALVVESVEVTEQHRAFVFAATVADDRSEVLGAVLGDRGALALLHFRQRIEIDSHAGIVLGDSLE